MNQENENGKIDMKTYLFKLNFVIIIRKIGLKTTSEKNY